MISTMIAATLYQGNPDRNHKLWNIGSIERNIFHMQVLLNPSGAPELNHGF
jgi:hypothetical protein